MSSFFRQHGLQVAAGLVLVGGSVVIGIAAGHRLLWLVLLGPMMVGACVPLVSLARWTDKINGWGAWFAAAADKVRDRDTQLAKYFQRPLYKGSLAVWRFSEPVSHQHLKAGMRLAALTYTLAALVFLLCVAIYVMLVVIAIVLLLLVVLWFMGNKDEEEERTTTSQQVFTSQETADPIDLVAPVRGDYYKGTNWFNEELAGRVDADGNIYKGTNWLNEEKIGRVDADGNVYKGTGWLNEEKVGRIDADGNLHKGSNWFNEEKTGRVKKD